MGTDEDSAATRPLLLVGGNLALDLANTVDDPAGPARYDHLTTWSRLVAWAQQVDLVDAAQAHGLRRAPGTDRQALVARAGELREVVRGVFGALADGQGDLDAHWPRLRPFAAKALSEARLDQNGTDPVRPAWRQGQDPAALVHPIASAALDLLRSDDLDRVKRCDNCPWLYLDRSKNHSRRWCSMQDCGTAIKTERYLARRAARRRAA